MSDLPRHVVGVSKSGRRVVHAIPRASPQIAGCRRHPPEPASRGNVIFTAHEYPAAPAVFLRFQNPVVRRVSYLIR